MRILNIKTSNFLTIIFIAFFINGCITLKDPIINKNESLVEYQYVLIPSTSNLTSGSGGIYGNDYGTYGTVSSKEINPGNIIEGVLLKKGYKSLDTLRQEYLDQTLIVKYGESGKRNVGLGGYTLEVTITFYSAKTYETIYSCTAEGIGATEADDIRKAITRCLSGL